MKTKLLSIFAVIALSTAIAIVACKKKEDVEDVKDETPFIVSFGTNPNVSSSAEEANLISIVLKDCNADPLFNVKEVQVNPSSAQKKLMVQAADGGAPVRTFSIIGKNEEKSRVYFINCIK